MRSFTGAAHGQLATAAVVSGAAVAGAIFGYQSYKRKEAVHDLKASIACNYALIVRILYVSRFAFIAVGSVSIRFVISSIQSSVRLARPTDSLRQRLSYLAQLSQVLSLGTSHTPKDSTCDSCARYDSRCRKLSVGRASLTLEPRRHACNRSRLRIRF
jgi:hypothetical protein